MAYKYKRAHNLTIWALCDLFLRVSSPFLSPNWQEIEGGEYEMIHCDNSKYYAEEHHK